MKFKKKKETATRRKFVFPKTICCPRIFFFLGVGREKKKSWTTSKFVEKFFFLFSLFLYHPSKKQKTKIKINKICVCVCVCGYVYTAQSLGIPMADIQCM